MTQTSDFTRDAMFTYEAALILNRFQMMARVIELSDGQEEKQTGEEDGRAATQKEKDREDYLRYRLEQVKEWERRLRGERQ